jgi:hypothetical protein
MLLYELLANSNSIFDNTTELNLRDVRSVVRRELAPLRVIGLNEQEEGLTNADGVI